ncbi:hypothetical protein [Arthrobacter sp. A5]|uniref:hypothetical protein n=1 Tax=Arthrobacter sp. A5 TaxID=576926 RepID=UPI003DA85C4C
MTSFLLGLIYRSWLLGRQDEIQDDVEDPGVATQDNFDAEEDSEIAMETTEFGDEEKPAAQTPGDHRTDPRPTDGGSRK